MHTGYGKKLERLEKIVSDHISTQNKQNNEGVTKTTKIGKALLIR